MQTIVLPLLLFLSSDPSYKPSPKDAKLKNAPAFVDSAKAGVENRQAFLLIEGSLPSSCHQLRLAFSGKADGKKQFVVKAYSVTEPKAMCAQMLQPFSVKVPVKAKKGTYAVVVNGQELAKVEVP